MLVDQKTRISCRRNWNWISMSMTLYNKEWLIVMIIGLTAIKLAAVF